MNSKPLQLGLLRNFSPLDGLKSENLHSLARKASLGGMSRGGMLFRQGESDKRTYFLVSGTVELMQHGRSTLVIRSGSPEARTPIAPTHPRHCSCRVISRRAEYIAIDSGDLDMVLMWDRTGRYEVHEVSGLHSEQSKSDDWMLALLRSPAFHRISPTNIQAIFLRMERLELRAGAQVIEADGEREYWYAIVKGRCAVTRETRPHGPSIRVAELGFGDTFGEEALICGDQRDASVSMLSDGVLMRLRKDDFLTLLTEPLLNPIGWPEAQRVVEGGGAWLDVRLPSDCSRFRLRNARSVPLDCLRESMQTLDRDKPYVVCCDSGRRSSAAAYILAARGFNASVLKGGLPADAVMR